MRSRHGLSLLLSAKKRRKFSKPENQLFSNKNNEKLTRELIAVPQDIEEDCASPTLRGNDLGMVQVCLPHFSVLHCKYSNAVHVFCRMMKEQAFPLSVSKSNVMRFMHSEGLSDPEIEECFKILHAQRAIKVAGNIIYHTQDRF